MSPATAVYSIVLPLSTMLWCVTTSVDAASAGFALSPGDGRGLAAGSAAVAGNMNAQESTADPSAEIKARLFTVPTFPESPDHAVSYQAFTARRDVPVNL